MEASNEKTSELAETTTAKTEAGTKKSVVDTWFDMLTLQTAKGLVVAQGALETVARWLDGRAKLVGDLASKLSSTTSGGPATSAEPTT